MRVTIDTSIAMAVLFNEPERNAIIRVTEGHELIAPASLPVEIGNAISLAFKRQRITLQQGHAVFSGYRKMRIQLQPIDYTSSIEICHSANIYAYDAYMIDLAKRENAHLFTLDKKLSNVAQTHGIKLLEIKQ